MATQARTRNDESRLVQKPPISSLNDSQHHRRHLANPLSFNLQLQLIINRISITTELN